jgi:predicted Na+-dependent transporter
MDTGSALTQAIGYAAALVLAVRMLAAGMSIKLSSLGQGAPEPPPLVLRSFMVLAAAGPLAAIAAIAFGGLGGTAAATLLLASVCIGPPVVASASDRPLARTLLLFMAASAVLTIPCWVWGVGRFYGPAATVAPEGAMVLMLGTVTLPLAVGLGVRRLADATASKLAPRLELVARGGLATTLAVALIWTAPALPRGRAGFAALIATALILLAAAGLSRWAAHQAGHDADGRSDTVARATIAGNPEQALAVVAVLFPEPGAIALVSAFLLARVVAYHLYHRVAGSSRVHRPRTTLRQRLA